MIPFQVKKPVEKHDIYRRKRDSEVKITRNLLNKDIKKR